MDNNSAFHPCMGRTFAFIYVIINSPVMSFEGFLQSFNLVAIQRPLVVLNTRKRFVYGRAQTAA